MLIVLPLFLADTLGHTLRQSFLVKEETFVSWKQNNAANRGG